MKNKLPSRLRFRRGLTSSAALLIATAAGLQAQTITTTTSNNLAVTVNSTVVRDHTTDPYDLGFNIGWVGIQTNNSAQSNLWNSSTKQMRQALYDYLKTDFTGAVYRYGSNRADWEHTIGTSRVNQNDGYGNYYPVEFGVDEFLRFVEQAQGVPMIFVNMYSIAGQAITTETQWQALKTKIIGYLEYCNAPSGVDWNGDGIQQGTLRGTNGHAAPYNVMRWELGNELDQTATYTKEKYALRCAELIAAMSALQPNLKFIAHARTAPWEHTNWSDWHKHLLSVTGTGLTSVAWHPYYDGHPVNAMNNYTEIIGMDIADWAANNSLSNSPKIALTEHAVDYSNGWTRTTSIQGVISVTDMMISHAQRKNVHLAINHELAACGPWALLSPVDAQNNYVLGPTAFSPRPIAYSTKLNYRVLRGADILGTSIVSPKTSSNGTYAYDVRATGYRYGAAGPQGVYLSNRHSQRLPTTFTVAGWPAGELVVRTRGVGGPDGEQAIWTKYLAATANASGQSAFWTPARAIMDTLVLGDNLVRNGNFELGTPGNLPTNWTPSHDSGVSASTTLVTDTTAALHGNSVARLQKTGGTGTAALVQPAWVNSAFHGQGAIANNPDATFVVRANVRTSGVAANSVRLKIQCFEKTTVNNAPAYTYVTASPFSAAAATDTAGLWKPLEIEFVPAQILQGKTFGYIDLALLNSSGTGYVDIDSVTVMQRKNWTLNPAFIDAGTNGLPQKWEKRIPVGSGGNVVYSTSTTPRFVTLSKTGGNAVQFAQSIQSGNAELGINGAVDARQNEKWRLRARVRHTGLDTNGGAYLKVQYFNSAGVFLSTSPLSEKLTGTQTAWRELVLEFNPRDLIGADKTGRFEIMLQNNSNTGSVDVSYVSLEPID